MPRRKKVEKSFDGGINVKEMVKALSAIEEEYSISPDQTIALLKQSFERAYKVMINDNNAMNIEDMRVEADVDIDSGFVTMTEIKDVVATDDDIEDDFLQITLEDAKLVDSEAEVGGLAHLPINLATLDERFKERFISRVRATFSQKMKEESRNAIRNIFADKVGENICGTVDNVEEFKITVNFNKASGVLLRRDLNENDVFKIGDSIKVYLKGINEKKKDGILIISRSDDNYLTNLFKEYIKEIEDGLIVIKGVARVPGARSKVAVMTTEPNIDPSGACIGPDGTRINSIRAEVANERIDVVRYNENIPLYIAESLRPAEVVGIALNEEEKTCLAVIKNENKRVAIGKKGINVRLASRLVGYNIDIKEQDEAMREGIKYLNLDDIRRSLALSKLDERELEEERNNTYIDTYEDEDLEDEDMDVIEEEQEVHEEEKKPVAPAPKQEVEVDHVEIKASKPKVSLSELEKQIEEEKKPKATQTSRKRKAEKPVEEEKKEEKPQKPVKPVIGMPIYTEEELKEIEEEEYEEDDRYSDYDDEYEDEYDKY